MLLRLFKGTGPGVIFLIIVTLLSVWFSAFFKLRGHFSLYFDLNPMPLYGVISSIIGTNPLPGIIFSLASVSLMSFLIVNLNTTLFFINERTFLPAFIYILISGLFPQYQLLNPAIFSALFLMLAIRRIMDAYRVQGTAYSFFDAGILIGTGSLFYANLIWFGILVIIGIALLRTGNIKEILISVIGLITPYILTFGIYYVLGKDLKDLWSILEYNLFGKRTVFEFTPLTIVAVIYLGLITLMSIVYLLVRMNTKKIQSRKTFSLFIWGFLITLGVYFILPSVSVEIVWLAGIPLSYFLTHYFVFSRKKVVPEILFSVLFVLILLIQILYLK
jgi:hypothetical protein